MKSSPPSIVGKTTILGREIKVSVLNFNTLSECQENLDRIDLDRCALLFDFHRDSRDEEVKEFFTSLYQKGPLVCAVMGKRAELIFNWLIDIQGSTVLEKHTLPYLHEDEDRINDVQMFLGFDFPIEGREAGWEYAMICMIGADQQSIRAVHAKVRSLLDT